MDFFLTQLSKIGNGLVQLLFISRTAGTYEMAAGKKLPVVFPGREVCQRIGAAYEIKFTGRAPLLLQDMNRIHRIRWPAPVPFYRGQGKAGIILHRFLDHVVSVKFVNMMHILIRRVTGWDKDDLFQTEFLPRRFRNHKMTDVDGIEGAAEQAYPFNHAYNTASERIMHTVRKRMSSRMWDSSKRPLGCFV